MKKVCAKVVPKILTPEQKEHRVKCCACTLENIENDPDFFLNVITCDETWIFQYDPETTRQSMHWKSPQSPRKKKVRMSKSKFKKMMIVFSISGGLSTLIVCLKVRLSIRFIIKMFWRPSVNVCDEGDQTCGRMPHGFFITTTRQHTTCYLWRGIWRKTTFQWWNIHRTLRT